MKRVPIGGLIVDKDLTFIRVFDLPDEPDWGGLALEEFCFYGMSLNFISENRDSSGRANLGVTLKVHDSEMLEKAKGAVSDLHPSISVNSLEPACLITVYGPHFKERCGLAATAFRALGIHGINILGISTSISSISMVVAQDDLDAAKIALEDVFELP